MLTKNAWLASQRILTGLTLCSAVALLSACGSDEDPDATGSSTSTATSTSTGTSSSAGTTDSSSDTSSSAGATDGTTSSNSSTGTGSTTSSDASDSTAASSSNATGSIAGVPADPEPNGRYRVNEDGKITDNGSVFNVQCGNWFGLEGQHEPKDAEVNPDGAPLELYIGNMWWDTTSERTIPQTMREIKELGINMIRLPVTPQTLEDANIQGTIAISEDGATKNSNGHLKNDRSAYPYDTAREALEGFLSEAKSAGLKVLVDIHSCSNYVGWRAGKLDAAPPWVDDEREGYDFTRTAYTCSGGEHDYNEAKWLDNLKDIAGLASTYDNIIGIDIFNEPWDYTWDQWATLAEDAYEAIDSVNKDVLVFVEGIGSGLYDGTDVDHGSADTNPNWGENFYGFNERPLQIPRERVVISPHTYGPAVYAQHHFLGDDCQGMTNADGDPISGDDAANAGCTIEINDENVATMRAGWEEHFGFLRDMKYAVVIGEFGGNIEWPHKGTREAEREMWGHLDDTKVDLQWQNAFVDYAIEEQVQACYWSINPESADTGGLYMHKWDPVDAEDQWGFWGDFDPDKKALVQRLWNNAK